MSKHTLTPPTDCQAVRVGDFLINQEAEKPLEDLLFYNRDVQTARNDIVDMLFFLNDYRQEHESNFGTIQQFLKDLYDFSVNVEYKPEIGKGGGHEQQ